MKQNTDLYIRVLLYYILKNFIPIAISSPNMYISQIRLMHRSSH